MVGIGVHGVDKPPRHFTETPRGVCVQGRPRGPAPTGHEGCELQHAHPSLAAVRQRDRVAGVAPCSAPTDRRRQGHLRGRASLGHSYARGRWRRTPKIWVVRLAAGRGLVARATQPTGRMSAAALVRLFGGTLERCNLLKPEVRVHVCSGWVRYPRTLSVLSSRRMPACLPSSLNP